jgi:hypothetical protein
MWDEMKINFIHADVKGDFFLVFHPHYSQMIPLRQNVDLPVSFLVGGKGGGYTGTGRKNNFLTQADRPRDTIMTETLDRHHFLYIVTRIIGSKKDDND